MFDGHVLGDIADRGPYTRLLSVFDQNAVDSAVGFGASRVWGLLYAVSLVMW
jgi:hypothetical protein